MREGRFHAVFPFQFPQVPGYDVAGIVLSAPAGSGFEPGDDVYARLPNRRPGAYAERAVVPVGLLARMPRTLSYVEAARSADGRMTTWQAFVERAALKSGERVLIQAGAGGVGTFAIQLAKHLGAQVVATGGAASQRSWPCSGPTARSTTAAKPSRPPARSTWSTTASAAAGRTRDRRAGRGRSLRRPRARRRRPGLSRDRATS